MITAAFFTHKLVESNSPRAGDNQMILPEEEAGCRVQNQASKTRRVIPPVVSRFLSYSISCPVRSVEEPYG